MKPFVRSQKTELRLGRAATRKVLGMMRSSAVLYNLLIEHLQYKREAWRKVKEQCPDRKPWDVDPYCDIRRKGWADELLIAFTTQVQTLYPPKLINKPAKQGKTKGGERLVLATRKNAKPDYGIPAQSKGALARDFEANIQSYFTHRKNGNLTAELPNRFKGLHTLFFTNQLIQRKGDRLILGARPYVISVRVPEFRNTPIDGDVKITRSRSGKFYLHVTRKFSGEVNPKLTEVASVDFGQRRAMVLALKDGTTATISGKEILALKRERDRRYRELSRLRARVYRGQLRQYLSADEQEKALSDTRYGWRMIRQRRRDGIDGKGRSLVELGQSIEGKPLRKRSKREFRLKKAQERAGDYYRVRLTYANHVITRVAVNWCIENKVYKVYVGDLKSLPKGRKKGNRRIKQVARNNLWEMPTQTKYLDEKLQLAGGEGAEEESEKFSSQVCPNCGRRHKPRNRNYFCNPIRGGCGWKGDRDGVGAVNFLSSVLYGACGKIKPAHNRTLQIAPAIRQGLRMPTPGSTATSEPAECAAKSPIPSGVQGSDIVQISDEAKTARNPLSERKTQVRGGKEMLAKAVNSDPSDFVTPVCEARPANTGGFDRTSIIYLQSQSQSWVQLTFWEPP